MTINNSTTEIMFNVVGRSLPREEEAAYSTLVARAVSSMGDVRESNEVELVSTGCWLDTYLADFGTELFDIDTYTCIVYKEVGGEQVPVHAFYFNVEQDNTQTDQNLESYGILRTS